MADPRFRSGLDAAAVDTHLRSAVGFWQEAEQNVVLWFAEFYHRGLFKKMGFGTIHLYASERLGFSESRTYQFLNLAKKMREMPELEEAVASGELGWTKARAVAQVATPKTAERWVKRAKSTSRRELEDEIGKTRRRAKARRKALTMASEGQLGLSATKSRLDSATPARADTCPGTGNRADVGPGTRANSGMAPGDGYDDLGNLADPPVSISVEMDSGQLARYKALVAKLNRNGGRLDRAELILAALESLLEREAEATNGATVEGGPTRTTHGNKTVAVGSVSGPATRGTKLTPAYQIHIHRCPDCETASVGTKRGDRKLDRAELESALCDAKVKRKGERNTSTLAPRVRKRAMERDRHRCAMPGCNSRHFLHVHHIVARADGGTHALDNLITLCGACHRALHELGKKQQWVALGREGPPG